MFIVLLTFADKARAADFMEGHKAWLQQGFDDGVFLLSGSLQPAAGGGIVAHNCSRTELEARVAADPFVIEGVVTADLVEIAPSRTDDRLAFLGRHA